MIKEQLKFSFMNDIEEVVLMKKHGMCPFCEEPNTLYNLGELWDSNTSKVRCHKCKREFQGEQI